jgi:hypothetical protein
MISFYTENTGSMNHHMLISNSVAKLWQTDVVQQGQGMSSRQSCKKKWGSGEWSGYCLP